MVEAWRIVKEKYAASAFDGEGARRYGGRWNSPGVAAVYTADSPALAALETLTGLNDSAPLSAFVLIPVSLPEDQIVTIDRRDLPTQWRASPAPPELAALGDAWLRAARSIALRVPSAVIEEQFNYVLNPLHPQFASLVIGRRRSFVFDERLLKGR